MGVGHDFGNGFEWCAHGCGCGCWYGVGHVDMWTSFAPSKHVPCVGVVLGCLEVLSLGVVLGCW